jgi:hypothetical protein
VAVVVVLLHAHASASSFGETVIRVIAKKSPIHGRSDIHDWGYIEISGDIRKSAVPRLVAAVVQAKKSTGMFTHSRDPVVQVILNSSGGEIQAAMQMGQILRAEAAQVYVEENAECSSACILVLAGGVRRNALPGAKLGIHRPFFQPEEFAELSHLESQDRYSALSASVRDYLSSMGIADTLFDAMMNVPSRKMKFLTRDFALATHLLGEDPAYEEWQRAKDLKALGPDRLRKLEQYSDCLTSSQPESECSKFLKDW